MSRCNGRRGARFARRATEEGCWTLRGSATQRTGMDRRPCADGIAPDSTDWRTVAQSSLSPESSPNADTGQRRRQELQPRLSRRGFPSAPPHMPGLGDSKALRILRNSQKVDNRRDLILPGSINMYGIEVSKRRLGSALGRLPPLRNQPGERYRGTWPAELQPPGRIVVHMLLTLSQGRPDQ
jgi:hypothetical protein